MNHLRELTRDELIAIEGGNWLQDAGAKCHEIWCQVKETVKEILDKAKERRENSPYCGCF